jgi:RNA polymerase sigma-70 factor (ECF subfamily)
VRVSASELSRLADAGHQGNEPGIAVELIRADTTSLPADDFDARFERARPRLLAVARSIVGADGAEDIVHDTYLAARSRVDQLRDPAALDRWLARIAENLCYQVLRRSSLRDRRQRGAAQPELVSDPALRDLVERLPLRERAILVLHYAHGYGLEEVAVILSLSYANVRALLSRTRRRMYREWTGRER